MDENHLRRRVWIPDEKEVWKLADLVSADEEKEQILVNDAGTEKTFHTSTTHPLDPTHLEDLDNLCSMNNLHEAPLLSILHRRFVKNMIYTTTGNVLISINPYRTIPGLYDSPLMYLSTTQDYCIASLNEKGAPHLFHIANHAFKNVSRGVANQSVIVSGESGAGKTEASKYVMQFLISANERMASSNVGDDIKRVLLDSNIIFESFGNSKTVRNDNSSRFGKYIKLQYNSENCLISAYTETFLLEKSRLSYVNRGERNYHIFYQMIRGLQSSSDYADKDSLHLDSVNDFNILTSGACTVLNSEDEDIAEFQSLLRALATMGVSSSELHGLLTMLSAILHLGNIECTDLSHSSEADGDDARKTHNVVLNSPCIPLAQLAGFLGVSEHVFVDSLTHHMVRVASARRMSTIKKDLKVEDVRHNILGLNKWLYSAVFAWLVRKINHAHLSVSAGHAGKVFSGRSRHSHAAEVELKHIVNLHAEKFIGILDIFGFEILQTNSFEQLCINFANERLQQQFNEHVFVNEQLEYEREGLNWSTITYQDNQHVIDLISKKPKGLLPILEEYGMLNRSPDDRALLSSFNQAHDAAAASSGGGSKGQKGEASTDDKKDPSSAYTRPRFGEESFVVRHFAGNVEYFISGFLLKNNDALQDDIMELLCTSTNTFFLNISDINRQEGEPGYLQDLEGEVCVPLPPPETRGGRGHTRATPPPPHALRGSSPPPVGVLGGNKKMATSSTVSMIFRSQLDSLMYTLRSTHPHYIKCIKPNRNKAPMQLEAQLVMEQLRYSGALEVVRIRREGFPQRCCFKEFYDPYSLLSRDREYRVRAKRRTTQEAIDKAQRAAALQATGAAVDDTVAGDDQDVSRVLAQLAVDLEWKGRAEDMASTFLPPDEFQVGREKLFLREGALKLMNLAMKHFLDGMAATIQAMARMKRVMRTYEKQRCNVIIAQSVVRMSAKRKKYLHSLAAVRRIQWFAMGNRLRKQYLEQLKAGKYLCYVVMGYRDRLKYLGGKRQRQNAALQLQCFVRTMRARKELRRRWEAVSAVRAAVRLQCFIRSCVARKEANKRIRSAVAIQAAARRKLCRDKYKRSLAKVVLLQALIRRRSASNYFKRSKRACVHIQSVCRSMIAAHRLRLAKASAVTIQSAIRRKKALQKYNIALSACVLIQSLSRMIAKVRLFHKSRKAATVIQSSIRRKIAVNNFIKTLRSCVLIQSICRMLVGRENLRRGKTAAVKIQSTIRRKLRTKQYTHMKQCCVTIQSLVRTVIASTRLRAAKEASRKIQSISRRKVALKSFQKSRQSCIRIQSLGRTFLARIKYSAALAASVRIQSVIRQFLARRAYEHSLKACVLIQTRVRQWTLKRKYKSLVRDVIKAQSAARRYVSQQRYKRDKSKIILTQAITRAYIAKLSYKNALKMTIRIQAFARRFNARTAYLNTIRMSVRIAARIRCVLARWRYLSTRNKCIRLQVAIRSFIRNRYLAAGIDYLYNLCKSGREQDIANVLATVPESDEGESRQAYAPHNCRHTREYMMIRQRTSSKATILQVALSVGNMGAVKALKPGPADILNKDVRGNAGAHYAAQYPSVDSFSYLASSMQLRYAYAALLNCGILGQETSPIAVAAAKAAQGRLWGRRGSFIVGDDDSDDENTAAAAVVAAAAANTGYAEDRLSDLMNVECIKEGWLKKRRVGGRWQKRWTVLSPVMIAYYKKRGDIKPKGVIPIEGSIIAREHRKEPIFEVINERLVVKKKHEGKRPSLEFLADNEKELQEWLIPMRALTGSAGGDRGFRPGPTEAAVAGRGAEIPIKDINYINSELRVAWLNDTNKEGETPLIVLCRFRNRGSDGAPIVPTARILQLALWLIVNGCNINTQNNQGQTALHVAVRYGNLELARCLVSKGADLDIRNNDGRTVLESSTREFQEEVQQTISAYPPGALEQTVIPGDRLRGYSYLTIHLQKHSQTSSDHRSDFTSLEFPFLSIAVYNSNRKLIEKVQNMPVPVVRRSTYVWWGCAWHMKTPLENIDDGCYVIIELKNGVSLAQIYTPPPPQAASGGTFGSLFGGSNVDTAAAAAAASPGTSVAWYMLPLDRADMDSGTQTLEFYQSPVLFPARAKDVPHPASAYKTDYSFLETNMLITKRGKDIDLIDYSTQPEWVHHHLPLPGENIRSGDVEITENIRHDETPVGNVSISKLLGLVAEQAEQQSDELTEEKIDQMSIKELKASLDTYNVDYTSFVEKSELKIALKIAVDRVKKTSSLRGLFQYAV